MDEKIERVVLMAEAFQEIVVMLLVMAGGAYFGKRGLLQDEVGTAINKVVLKITFPAMIIASMDREFTKELFTDSIIMIVLSFILYILVIMGLEVWGKFSKRDKRTLGVMQYLILFGNVAFMGYPVVSAVYGDIGVFFVSMFNIAHNFICFSYGLTLLNKEHKADIKQILVNPAFLATSIGFVLFLIPGMLPYIVYRPLEWVGNATIPLALLVVGSKLGRSRVRELVQPVEIWITTAVRLLVFPLILLLILPMLPINPYLIYISILLFGTPVALTAASFAEEYGADAHMVGKAVVLSNLLSLLTMTGFVTFVTR